MGLFRVEIQLLPAVGDTVKTMSVLVDTGASYLALPGSLLTSLGYRAVDRQRVVFATGEAAVWDVTEVRVRLQGRERTVLAFLTPDGAPQLLGAQTLETFGLGVDPLGNRLVPVDAYLASQDGGASPETTRRVAMGHDCPAGDPETSFVMGRPAQISGASCPIFAYFGSRSHLAPALQLTLR